MNTTALIEQLKAEGQDFPSFTPQRGRWWKQSGTIDGRKWIDCTGYHVRNLGEVLDIGCGTCNFRRWVDDLNAPLKASATGDIVHIARYYVMEKSRILLDKLDAANRRPWVHFGSRP